MNKKLSFLKNPGFYMMLAVCVLVLVSLCTYAANGATQFNKETIASSVIALCSVSVVLSVLCIVADVVLPATKFAGLLRWVRFIEYFIWLLLFGAFVELIVTEINFIGNVFVATDPVDTVFIVNYLVAIIPVLVGGIISLVAGLIGRRAAAKGGSLNEKAVQ